MTAPEPLRNSPFTFCRSVELVLMPKVKPFQSSETALIQVTDEKVPLNRMTPWGSPPVACNS